MTLNFLLQLSSNALLDILTFYCTFSFLLSTNSSICILENTRTVARNLGCRKNDDDSKPVKSVDVLIPEVIQVVFSF